VRARLLPSLVTVALVAGAVLVAVPLAPANAAAISTGCANVNDPMFDDQGGSGWGIDFVPDSFKSGETITVTASVPANRRLKASLVILGGNPEVTLFSDSIEGVTSYTKSFTFPADVVAAPHYNMEVYTLVADGGHNSVGQITMACAASLDRGPQTITFGALADATLPQSQVPLVASSTSSLPVAFSSLTPATCAVQQVGGGFAAKYNSHGVCTIAADQIGDPNFLPATQVTRSFTFIGKSQTITVTAPDPVEVGQPEIVSATASSDLPTTITTSTPGICSLTPAAGGTYALLPLTAGTCTLVGGNAGDNIYEPASTTVSITVSPAALAPQTIDFPQPGDMKVTVSTDPLAATATSGLAVVFTSATPAVCSVLNDNKVKGNAAGTCTIAADQPGDASHEAAAQVIRSFAISRYDQTITFPALADTVLGGAEPGLSASATSGNVPVFSSLTPTVCSVTGGSVQLLAAGTCTIAADEAGNSTYSPAPQVTRSFAIAKKSQTISFTAPGSTVYGGADVALSATATSGGAVAFSSLTPAICSVVSGKAHPLGAGTCTIAANQAGNGTYGAAPQVTRSLTVAKAGLTLTTRTATVWAGWFVLRQGYTTTVRSKVTGLPVAGVSVTHTVTGKAAKFGCTATTNAKGVATCVSSALPLALWKPYTATAAASANFTSGSVAGRLTLF
jgi:hypothetical protein